MSYAGMYDRDMKVFVNQDIYNSLDILLQENKNDSDFSILLVHDPPRNTKLDKVYGGEHVGSQSIYNIIEKYQPNLAVCGHIHESQGIDTIKNSTIVNAGDWKFNKNYAIISINEDGKIDIKFHSQK